MDNMTFGVKFQRQNLNPTNMGRFHKIRITLGHTIKAGFPLGDKCCVTRQTSREKCQQKFVAIKQDCSQLHFDRKTSLYANK